MLLRLVTLLLLLVLPCAAEVPYTTGSISVDENFKWFDSQIKKKKITTVDNSSLTLTNSNLVFSTTTGSYGIMFQDGTSMVSAGVASSTITTNAAQFSGNGGALTPLTLQASSVTLQGNTFNGASKLLQLDTSSKVPVAQLPTDGYASTYVNITGDNMTGQLTVASSVTVTGVVSVSSYVKTGVYTGVYDTSDGLRLGAYNSISFHASENALGAQTDRFSISGGDGAVDVNGAIFRVGGSTFTVTAGKVGIRTASPAYTLDVNGAANFVSSITASTVYATDSASTSTFSGYVDYGVKLTSETYSSGFFADLTCPTGTYIVSGGCFGGLAHVLRDNYMLSETTWRCTRAGSGGTEWTAYVLCGRHRWTP